MKNFEKGQLLIVTRNTSIEHGILSTYVDKGSEAVVIADDEKEALVRLVGTEKIGYIKKGCLKVK